LLYQLSYELVQGCFFQTTTARVRPPGLGRVDLHPEKSAAHGLNLAIAVAFFQLAAERRGR
jgi:hypothetical protein